jgi:hypothetical protein
MRVDLNFWHNYCAYGRHVKPRRIWGMGYIDSLSITFYAFYYCCIADADALRNEKALQEENYLYLQALVIDFRRELRGGSIFDPFIRGLEA